MKTIAAALLAASLAGCSTIKGQLENRLVVTLTGDRAFVAQLYGPFGLTTELSADDARELQAMREKAGLVDMIGAAASRR